MSKIESVKPLRRFLSPQNCIRHPYCARFSRCKRELTSACTSTQHIEKGGFFQTVWLARDKSSFFHRKRVPGPQHFLLSLNAEIVFFYTVNIDHLLLESKTLSRKIRAQLAFVKGNASPEHCVHGSLSTKYECLCNETYNYIHCCIDRFHCHAVKK